MLYEFQPRENTHVEITWKKKKLIQKINPKKSPKNLQTPKLISSKVAPVITSTSLRVFIFQSQDPSTCQRDICALFGSLEYIRLCSRQ